MGRILVVHPQRGLLDLITGVLRDAHQVDVVERYEAAITRLDAKEAYDAVLCTLNEPLRTVEVFQKSLLCHAATLLIPIARDATQIGAFQEQWQAADRHQQTNGCVGPAWLPERPTVHEIRGLLVAPNEPPASEIEAVKPPASQPASRLTSGIVIDGYRLLGVIGRGGFGTTWMAVNETSGKRVALKMVEGEEQTRQELAALRKYVHVADRSEHLLPIEHINRDGHRLWVISPLADSLTGGDTVDSYQPRSLANWLQVSGHSSELEAVRIAACLVRALLPLHQAGLLHGDVSPSNTLTLHGRWVLADPSLVRFQGEHGICRDRAYYPQPQVTQPRDDLYAVGIILWELVSGVGEMLSGKERLRLDGQMFDFLSRKELPTAAFLRRSGAENPAQRYLNAGDMLRDLESLETQLARKSSSQNSLYHLLRALRTG